MDEQTARELNVVAQERELLKATKVIVAALMDGVARAFNCSESYLEVADELDKVGSRLRARCPRPPEDVRVLDRKVTGM